MLRLVVGWVTPEVVDAVEREHERPFNRVHFCSSLLTVYIQSSGASSCALRYKIIAVSPAVTHYSPDSHRVIWFCCTPVRPTGLRTSATTYSICGRYGWLGSTPDYHSVAHVMARLTPYPSASSRLIGRYLHSSLVRGCPFPGHKEPTFELLRRRDRLTLRVIRKH